MNGILFYPAGDSPALTFAIRRLRDLGYAVADHPATDVTHLLLGVPSFDDAGNLRGGGDLNAVLSQLPKNVTVIGGNLQHPLLERYATMDLLQDAWYLAQNAAITADCALQVARSHLPVVLQGCPVLILGWGRIGKCLSKLLKASGAYVTVAARKETDLAMLQALGYEAEQIEKLRYGLVKYRLIFNTVPYPVLDQEQAGHCSSDCIKIELASRPGIVGEDVIQARGLPGKMAPESAGLLIAKSVIRQIAHKEA
jgi:dipicolinate synthase subunit A